ncbi:MAG: ATP-binding protein [Salibacteraceae bacterium]
MKKTVIFSSQIQNLDIAEKFVYTICDFEDIDEKYFGNILIAVTESVTNAIHHGNQQDPDKSVTLKYFRDNKLLGFHIEDEGLGFDHNKLADPTLPENLEKETGRGVFLMKSLADEVVFENEGRVVQLKFSVTND